MTARDEYNCFRDRQDCFPTEVQRKLTLSENLASHVKQSTPLRQKTASELLSSFPIHQTSLPLILALSFPVCHEGLDVSSQVFHALNSQIDELSRLIELQARELNLTPDTQGTINVSAGPLDGSICHCKSMSNGPIISCSICGDYSHTKCANLNDDHTGIFLCQKCKLDPKSNVLLSYPFLE
ncbi:hypothetical protein GEMRC1_010915 [Eukaryota sp. GEM-RC1]